MPITDYHRKIFDYLEDFRQSHPEAGLTYALREKNGPNRPRNQYLFTGNDKYLCVALYAPNNGKSKTRSIAFFCQYDAEKDRLVDHYLGVHFHDPKFASDRRVYFEILKALGRDRLKFFSEEYANMHYGYDDWRTALHECLTVDKPKMDEVIRNHGKESSFFIAQQEFQGYLDYLKQNPPGSNLPADQLPTDQRRYWKYSPGRHAVMWPDNLVQQAMAINFSEYATGPLDQYQTLEELETELKVPKNSLNDTWNLFSFASASEGDVVFANKGRNEVLGIGVIAGPYHYHEDISSFRHSRPVTWLADKPWVFTEGSIPKMQNLFRVDTFAPTRVGPQIIEAYCRQYPEYIPVFSQHGLLPSGLQTPPAPPSMPTVTHPKNIILYGPPGTGKTYNTIDLAVEIATGVKTSSHAVSKQQFDALLHDQIEFITFHQNYSYEDFVMGLKPDLDETGTGLRFRQHEGIFYQLAKRANENFLASKEEKHSFEELYEKFCIALMDNEGVYWSGGSYIVDTNNDRIQGVPVDSRNTFVLPKEFFKKLYEGIPLKPDEAKYFENLGDGFLKFIQFTTAEPRALKNYVLIIDEINRANMSRVFGELITLLEDDKRLGGENEIRLLLPSGERFGVPPNLYLIGTMNTADKSLALLDIALRRRFEFIGMYPRYDLPGMVPEVAALLQRLNDAIHRHKHSADFLIGHAYFLSKERHDLKTVFNNRVIPLLMEYFSGRTDLVEKLLAEAGITARRNSFTFQLEVDDL